jgi:hypothetical protein
MDVLGFPDYRVSNLGRVMSIARTRLRADGRVFHYKDRILKPGLTSGYWLVVLRRDNKSYSQYVHILVATAFHGVPPDGLEVNHKDGNRSNCVSTNLEWVTHQQNMQHSVDTGLRKVFVNRYGMKRNPNADAVTSGVVPSLSACQVQ